MKKETLEELRKLRWLVKKNAPKVWDAFVIKKRSQIEKNTPISLHE